MFGPSVFPQFVFPLEIGSACQERFFVCDMLECEIFRLVIVIIIILFLVGFRTGILDSDEISGVMVCFRRSYLLRAYLQKAIGGGYLYGDGSKGGDKKYFAFHGLGKKENWARRYYY